jgi:hypothetical protein
MRRRDNRSLALVMSSPLEIRFAYVGNPKPQLDIYLDGA